MFVAYKEMITQQKLLSILKYEPNTGEFVWLVDIGKRIKAGDKAGANAGRGYFRICIEYKLYYVHRLAFLYMKGYMPKYVDHKDKNRSNNKWTNLREATHSQNLMNGSLRSNSRSGVIGVSFLEGRWRAYIKKNYQNTIIGYFDTKEEAIQARKAKEIELFGEFAP